jgi:divalent metal cation (Fe/Co/Zn/Cd) transporter
VNLHVEVPGTLTAFELSELEEEIVAALKAEMKDVKEVQVQFGVVSEKEIRNSKIPWVHGFVCYYCDCILSRDHA